MCSSDLLAARDGDWTVAIRDSLASMKIGQDVTIGGGVTLYLVGSALQGMGAATVRALVLQTEVPAAQLRVAIRDLQSRRGTGQPVAETLRYELAALGKVLSGTDSDLLPASRFTLSADRTRRQFEAAYGDLIAESEKPFWLSKPALVRQRWRFEAEPLWLRVFQQPVAKLLVDMNLLGVSDLGARAARVQLEWDATMVTCALVLFRRDHGKTAATLADLAPAYLLAVPSDPFCGEPLRYRVDGQNWVLWSVGSDGVDNAARFQEFRHRNESGELAGGDIFYTSTEPQVDRERYRDCLKKSKRPQ